MVKTKGFTSVARKTVQLFFRTLFGLAILVLFFCIFYWYNNRLFWWEASLLWPQKKFSEAEFRLSSPVERSQMVVDIIRNNRLLGMPTGDIDRRLGENTGDYYYSESNFTYRLTEKGETDWILTLVSGESGKVEHVFIRKSCCSISRRILLVGMEISDSFIENLLR